MKPPKKTTNQSNLPLVSIITPYYNQGLFIEDAILSVKNQDYPFIEHIIMDGGSKDNTQNVIKKYEKSYNLKWISEPDKGQTDALNKGFKMAKGDIIGWINSDDAYFSISTITNVVNIFSNNSKIKIIYGDMILMDKKNTVTLITPSFPFFSFTLLKRRNFINQPSVFLRKSIIDKYYLNDKLHYSMDYLLWLDIGKDEKFFHVHQILSCFRQHEKSKSGVGPHMMENEDDLIRKENYPSNKLLQLLTPLIRLFFNCWPILGTVYIFNCYKRNDFAFDLKFPDKNKLIRNNLLINNFLKKFFTVQPKK